MITPQILAAIALILIGAAILTAMVRIPPGWLERARRHGHHTAAWINAVRDAADDVAVARSDVRRGAHETADHLLLKALTALPRHRTDGEAP